MKIVTLFFILFCYATPSLARDSDLGTQDLLVTADLIKFLALDIFEAEGQLKRVACQTRDKTLCTVDLKFGYEDGSSHSCKENYLFNGNQFELTCSTCPGASIFEDECPTIDTYHF